MRLFALLVTLFALVGCTNPAPLPENRVGSYFPVALDLNINGQTRGDVLVRDTSNWTRLPAGTSGQLLETLGPGVLPVWVNAPASFTPGVTTRLTALDANDIHAWEMTEASGTTLADTGSSGTPVNLTLNSAAGTTLGTIGILGPAPIFGITAADGTGAASSGACALVSAFLDLPLTNFTIEAWGYSSNGLSAQSAIIFDDDFGAAVNLQFNSSTNANNRWDLTTRATGFVTSSSTAAAYNVSGTVATWHYYAITYDGANQKIYVDAELVATAAQTGNIQWTNTSGTAPKICVGSNISGGNPWVGRLSRERMSNIVRSQTYLRSVFAKANYY